MQDHDSRSVSFVARCGKRQIWSAIRLLRCCPTKAVISRGADRPNYSSSKLSLMSLPLLSKSRLPRRISRYRRAVTNLVLLCIGFFHVTVVFSACMPFSGAGIEHAGSLVEAAGPTHNGSLPFDPAMRVSDLLCKTHCDSANSPVSQPLTYSPMVLWLIGPMWSFVQNWPSKPVHSDLANRLACARGLSVTAEPEPVYLLSSRLRV